MYAVEQEKWLSRKLVGLFCCFCAGPWSVFPSNMSFRAFFKKHHLFLAYTIHSWKAHVPQEFEWWVEKRKGLNQSQLRALKSSCLILQNISQKEVYLWAVRDLNAVQIGQSQSMLVSQIFIFYNTGLWFAP